MSPAGFLLLTFALQHTEGENRNTMEVGGDSGESKHGPAPLPNAIKQNALIGRLCSLSFPPPSHSCLAPVVGKYHPKSSGRSELK